MSNKTMVVGRQQLALKTGLDSPMEPLSLSRVSATVHIDDIGNPLGR